jgi:hypothetical protein
MSQTSSAGAQGYIMSTHLLGRCGAHRRLRQDIVPTFPQGGSRQDVGYLRLRKLIEWCPHYEGRYAILQRRQYTPQDCISAYEWYTLCWSSKQNQMLNHDSIAP